MGHEGRVVTGIPAEGLGVVQVNVGGTTSKLNARAGQPLATGTRVHVTETLSPTAVTEAQI